MGRQTGDGLRFEDQVEREVRKRLAETMSSAGVNQGRISMEVLYWLPENFARLYMQMVDKALKMDDGVGSSMGGQSGDEGQIKARVGTGPAKGKQVGGLFTRESGAHARGTGKRYRQHWLVKDEAAFKLKGQIDRKLQELAALIAQGGGGKMGKEREKNAAGNHGGPTPGKVAEGAQEPMEEIQGGNPMERILRVVGSGRRQCTGCGKMASKGWVICPRPHNQGKVQEHAG